MKNASKVGAVFTVYLKSYVWFMGQSLPLTKQSVFECAFNEKLKVGQIIYNIQTWFII